MLLARANLRGVVRRPVANGVNLAESKIFDFSYLRAEDYLLALMTYMAFNVDGTIISMGNRQLISKVNAAGNAFEGQLATQFGENDAGLNPMIPDFGGVAGNNLALTFAFNNTSAVIMTGVVDYSFAVSKA